MLPEGWTQSKLSEVVEFNPRHAPDSDRDQLVSFIPMPALDERLGAITRNELRPLRDVWNGFTHFADRDVIFAKITPCMENGKAAVVSGMTNGIACGSTEFFVLRSTGATLPEYVWRLVRQDSFRLAAEQHMSGAVGQRRVPRLYLENYSLPLPPLAEQRRIVAKLDALTARLACARAELERVRRLTSRLRQRTLHTEIQRAHEENGSARAEQWFSWSSGKFLPKGQQSGGGVPVFGGNGINGYHNEANSEEPTLVIGRVGAQCGNIHLTGAQAWITDNAIFAKKVDVTVDLRFALHLFRSANLIQKAAGTGQPYVNQEALNSVPYPSPSHDEQVRIGAKIDAAFARADRLEAEAVRARALLDRLEAALLAKAFRGELVPHPADEPASVLLDRIRAERAVAPKIKRGRRIAPTLRTHG